MNTYIFSIAALVKRVPVWAWLALAGLGVAPIYLRYFAWALGQCGVGFWAPIR